MPVATACAACGAKVKIPDTLLGKRVKCPRCARPIALPTPAPEDSAPQPPPEANVTAPARCACPFCGESILATARKCKHCGERMDDSETRADSGRKAGKRSQGGVPLGMLTSVTGAALLGLGLFLPILKAWQGLSFIDYHANSVEPALVGMALIVVVGLCAALSLFLGIVRLFLAVGVVGMVALIGLITAAVLVHNRISGGRVLISWSWGWGVLGLGAVLLLVTPLLPRK